MLAFISTLKRKILKTTTISFIALGAFAMTAIVPLQAMAATAPVNPQSVPKISFTFDDNLQSTYTNALPILQQYGLTATDYVITGCVGMTTTPNTCWANQDTPYMTWSQIQALQNTYGWEIGSHTVDHLCLASNAAQDPGDCQANTMTTAQVDAELANSKSALAANGINATDFAPPYGDFNNSVMAEIAKYYASMRQFANAANNPNAWPYSDYYLQNFPVQEKLTPVSSIETAINNAISKNQWLILTFHNIETKPSRNPDDYEYGTTELSQIAAYVQSKRQAGLIQSVTIHQGLATGKQNLMPNTDFKDGIADGWTTDKPGVFSADSGGNGSYPDPTHSIKFTAGATTTHLFSPRISVNSSNTYLIKSFLNVLTNSGTGGQVGFYVDEYDAGGNWISGQYKATESSSFVEDVNFGYTPTSANVAQANFQFIVGGNSGVSGYLANVQWMPVTNNVVTYTNLMPNSTFDAGVSNGWTTDSPSVITADSGGNGSPTDSTNSIKLQSLSSSSNDHLFSPKISVSSANSYTISSYLNLKQITSGVFGFYIDEYNANGTWISGQYKTDRSSPMTGTVAFSYSPTSSSVASASVQFIVVGNSNTLAYIDDVYWYKIN